MSDKRRDGCVPVAFSAMVTLDEALHRSYRAYRRGEYKAAETGLLLKNTTQTQSMQVDAT
jgi:hypothetical protein